MSTQIHATAIVDPAARLGNDVSVGPFCVIGADVEIGARTRLHAHVTVSGPTLIGEDCEIFPQAALGGPPQDKGYRGEPTRLEIGDGCQLHEAVILHRGTVKGGGVTRVGANCYLMAYSHAGHDCILGDGVTLANGAQLGGHCHVGERAIISGLAALHQFTHVGHHAFVGGGAIVVGDVIPYGMVVGNQARHCGLNLTGLKRAGLSRADIHALRACYRLLFEATDASWKERLARARSQFVEHKLAVSILDFIEDPARRRDLAPGR